MVQIRAYIWDIDWRATGGGKRHPFYIANQTGKRFNAGMHLDFDAPHGPLKSCVLAVELRL